MSRMRSDVAAHLCNESNIHDDEDEHHAPYKLMYLFFVLFVGCLLKTLLAPLRVPYTGVILSVGLVGGVLFNIFSQDDTFVTITTASPDVHVGIFLPTLIFESAYRTEYHAFMKSISPILSISIVGYFTVVASISLVARYLFFFQQWTYLECLLLGVTVSATRPVTLMRRADYGRTKRLSVLLEGETVINNSLALVLFNTLKRFTVNGQSWNTLDFLKTTSIALIGGIGLGSLIGAVEIISLPYFYDDPISEVTITIAVPYMLYWLCEQAHCSGAVAIAVLGLLLSNYKTAISSEATIFLEKFWDMLTLIANTIVYLLTALTIAELVKPPVRAAFGGSSILVEVALAIVNYFICYLVRFVSISALTFCTSCQLSWKDRLLVTWGGLKGATCLILAVALAGEIRASNNSLPPDQSSKFQYQILIQTMTIVFLSSCINATHYLLLKILDFTTMSSTKYRYMAQCVESLRHLVHEKIELLKKNKYLANADWLFIENNFRIDNPHAPSAVGDRAESELSESQRADLHEEARVRVLNIQKTSFWRQYRDYEISTQAVRILSSLCDYAMDRKGRCISIDQLKDYYKSRTLDSMWKYLRLLVCQVHRWFTDDWRRYQKAPKGKWRLLIFRIVNAPRYHWFMTCVTLLNVTLSVIRMAMNVPGRFSLTFMLVQSSCTAIYTIESGIKIFAFGMRVYLRTWIEYRIEFLLTIVAIGECIFENYAVIRPQSISRRTWSSMQILLVVQLLRFSRWIESLAAHFSIVLERIGNRYVTLSLELCKAYITSEDDVLAKLRRIIEDDRVREQLYKDSMRRRSEVITELTCIQNEHPNVAASVQTSTAIQKLLNYSKNMIHHMASKGLLGENEAHRITENMNQRLHTDPVPTVLPFPTPLNFLHVFPWLHDPDVLEYVLSRLHVQLFSLNEYIYQANDDAQALYFITAGYVETVKETSAHNDALSAEQADPKSNEPRDVPLSDVEEASATSYRFAGENKPFSNYTHNALSHLKIDDSVLDLHPKAASAVSSRLLHAPGDILGHVDLLNGRKYTETCRCITNTLVWYLNSADAIDLIERFKHLRILEKLWHYASLQLAEVVLYEYLNTLPAAASEQERIHIYGHLKRAFLIPESYLREHEVIYSSHELILIQGQLRNTVTSSVYTSPCFIQIEFGQCGLKPLNIGHTKILVLRSPQHHPVHLDEFTTAEDLPDLLTHLIYDDKLGILLPRTSSKHPHETSTSIRNESVSQTIKKTVLGRFLESLPKFQRRTTN